MAQENSHYQLGHQQRQRELDAQKGARPKERVVTISRPESRMEVDEAPRVEGLKDWKSGYRMKRRPPCVA